MTGHRKNCNKGFKLISETDSKRKENINQESRLVRRARFGWIRLVKVLNKFRGMIKFGSEDPRGFFVSAFIASPSYEV